jgi:putative OmpL-like beta-barrel porin-2
MRARPLACLIAALVCVPALAAAQSSSSMYSNLANPAIGMNSLFDFRAAHNLNEAYGLHFDAAEISLLSVVDPYWAFASNIVFAEGGVVDPEEAWARNTSIPSVQLKLGKIRGFFGKQGLLHTHAFPFIEGPIVMPNTIGEEGFKDTGIEAAWLTPLPWYAELTGGVYQAEGPSADNPLDFGSTAHDNVPYLGHFKNQFDVTNSTTLEVGQSALQGRGADGHHHAAYGADVTFRNVPAQNSNRRGWILTGEYLQRGSTIGSDYVRNADGGYASFQYRLSQLWWAGVRGEEARDSFADFVVDDAGTPLAAKVTRVSANVSWNPSEFSFVRLEYSHANADAGIHRNDDRILAQVSYTIGYHPAHAY